MTNPSSRPDTTDEELGSIAFDPDDRFLKRLDAEFDAQGAERLFPDVSGPAPLLSKNFVRLYVVSSPGIQELYAVVQWSGRDVQELAKAWDRLAASLSLDRLAMGAPLDCVLVALAEEPASDSLLRRATRAVPSGYVPGLRPSTCVVDVDRRRVISAGFVSRGEGVKLLERAARNDVSPVVTGRGATAMERDETNRQFYSLMRHRRPIVTVALIVVNLVMFGVVQANGGPTDANLTHFGALQYSLALRGQWWRLFTAMFLHAGVEHILFNMTSLFALGLLAERLYGSFRFLIIYLGSGLIASAGDLFVTAHFGNAQGGAVGASGAIFGVAGALLTVRFQRSSVIPGALRERISRSMLPLVVVSLAASQAMAANVDLWAHLSGLAGGAVLPFVLMASDVGLARRGWRGSETAPSGAAGKGEGG